MYYSKKKLYIHEVDTIDERKKRLKCDEEEKNVIFPFYINAKMILKMILKLDQKKNISSCVY